MTDVHDEFEPGDHFHLGGAKAEYLEVWVLSRSEAEDYWDGNWLSCEVRLSLGGFRGQFSAYFRTNELGAFADEVRTLYHDLNGTARFESMEEQLHLVLQGDGRGTWHRALAFRDPLRADAGLRNTYAVLKRELAQRHGAERSRYTEGKSALSSRCSRTPRRAGPS